MPHLRLQLRERLAEFCLRLVRYATRNPKGVLYLASAVMLVSAPGVLRLKLRTDGQALLSSKAPEVTYDRSIRGRFGIEDQIVTLVRTRHPDGIFNPATLQLVRELTALLQKIPGTNPTNVISLSTEASFRLRPGSLAFQRLLEPPLTTKAELDQLRQDLRRIGLYTGTLVSIDANSTAILVGVPAGADRMGLYESVLEAIASRSPQSGAADRTTASDEISVAGAPVAESLLGIQILEDLGVPKWWLGLRTRTETERWKPPHTMGDVRRITISYVGLVPLAALVMMAVFLLTFQNVLAALLPVPGVLATLVFVFGGMGWFGVPIYLTIAAVPVLLTTISVTNDIYLFSRYFALLREQCRTAREELVGKTFECLVLPVATTSFTAAIGFLSFVLSPLKPVQAFGMVCGIGVLFGWLYSLTVVPALLVLINPAWLSSWRFGKGRDAIGRHKVGAPRGRGVDVGGREPGGRLAAGFGRLARWVVCSRSWVAGGFVLVLALTPFGLRRLVVQDSWADAFDSTSAFRRAMRLGNDGFYGMHVLLVSVEAPEVLEGQVPASALRPEGVYLPGALAGEPALLAGSTIKLSVPKPQMAKVAAHQQPIVWEPHIEMVAGPVDRPLARLGGEPATAGFWPALSAAGVANFSIVVQSHFRPELLRMIGALGSLIRQQSRHAVGGVITPLDLLETTRFMARPDDPNARVLGNDPNEIKLMWEYYGFVRGYPRLRQVVDRNYWQSLTTVFLKDANFADTAQLMAKIRAYERESLLPQRIKIGFAGDVALSQSLIGGIVATQIASLVWSLAGIYLVTALLGRSAWWGLYCLVPSLIAVVVKFAFMGWCGISLGVATSMFAAMTLGIGVNCAIHLLEAATQPQPVSVSPLEGLSRALRRTGPPALINTLAVSLGFSVLMLSQVPANQRLSLLLILGLVNCFVASLLLLPAVLSWHQLNSSQDDHPL